MPIVPGAVIFDLDVGDWAVGRRPNSGTRPVTRRCRGRRRTVGAGVGACAGVLKAVSARRRRH
ncbi:hypothetical protein I553_3305 [Mycobacterium xenopi 4042]|uniref:Uncharacterized protein n=1 Tax=Mycobacterium xenopi 4042 TaxID=1299334 RepID=X8CIY6_MYCXE|nr:hypothetical protein I553_3305 [Mycobacterium xenopi 4042]